MTPSQRVFGSGPRGLLISLLLWIIAWQLEPVLELPHILQNDPLRWVLFVLSILVSFLFGMWGLASLPPTKRGHQVVDTGAYKHVRHPLYASLLSSFNFGLAVFLNNWIYLLWAALLHPLWHWNIRKEEKLMAQEFPGTYEAYCQRTGRFFPRLWK